MVTGQIGLPLGAAEESVPAPRTFLAVLNLLLKA